MNFFFEDYFRRGKRYSVLRELQMIANLANIILQDLSGPAIYSLPDTAVNKEVEDEFRPAINP